MFPEGLEDETDLEESYDIFRAQIDEYNDLNRFLVFIQDTEYPTECLDECCEWRKSINEVVLESNADAVMIQNILGGADSEANRQAFIDSGLFVDESFDAPPAPAGGCVDEAAYVADFEHAIGEVVFLSQLESWCSSDPANCSMSM